MAEMNEQWKNAFEVYSSKFKANKSNVRTIGTEKEFPVIDVKTGIAFDVRRIFPDLIADGGKAEYDPVYKDEILAVEYKNVMVTTDAGWGTLELPSIPAKTIHESKRNFDFWMNIMKDLIEPKGGKILGYGIQPMQRLHPANWIKKRRHQVVCENFGCIHDVNITITASDQVHVSVDEEEAVRVNRVMNFLTAVIISLSANSPVWQEKVDGVRLAPREFMWWFSPKNRHGVDVFGGKNLEEYFQRMMSLQHLVAFNCKDYFRPKTSFKEFIEREGFDNFRHEIPTLEGTFWKDSRLRSIYGTIEVRPACQQPLESAMAIPAFVLGIIENLESAEKMIEDFGCSMEDAEELRELAMSHGLKASFQSFNSHFTMAEMCLKFLKIARTGLHKRGNGEEKYLNAFFERAFNEKTLAEECIEIFNAHGLYELIERVAY